MWLLLAVAAVAGILASWFLPAGVKSPIETILPFVSLACATFSLALWWLASRLGRDDVSNAERFARRVFFTRRR